MTLNSPLIAALPRFPNLRYGTLLTIVVAHLLALWLWPTERLQTPLVTVSQLLLLQLPEQPAKPVLPQPPLQLNIRPPVRTVPAKPELAPPVEMPTISVPAAATSEPTLPDQPALDQLMRSYSLKDLATIDRELRSSSRQLPSLSGKPDKYVDKFARAISSAAVEPNGKMEVKTFPDGQRIVRVFRNGKSYCVRFEGAGGGGDGIDHGQNGNRAKVTNCGNLFD